MNIFKAIGRAFIPANEAQARALGRIIGLALVLLFILGFRAVAEHEEPAQAPALPASAQVPPAEFLTTGAEAATACTTNPGNPSGYCWYTGWRFPQLADGRTWVCIDSSIPGAPLGGVANLFRAIDSRIVISAYVGAGQCKAHGFPSNRRVTFYPFTTHDKYANQRTCGMMLPRNYGAYFGTAETLPMIKINVTGYKTTLCGGGYEWQDVFAHELGHAFGLSHAQPRTTSIMREGHVLDGYDKCYIRIIHRAYGPGCRAMNIP